MRISHRLQNSGALERTITGWVGIVRGNKKSLINTGDPLDHLESRIFLADYF
eukprot:COSAG02_NODE_194_length_29788_cov_20.044090_9_plen_52_part_00